jgi:hypothetical protein
MEKQEFIDFITSGKEGQIVRSFGGFSWWYRFRGNCVSMSRRKGPVIVDAIFDGSREACLEMVRHECKYPVFDGF